MKAEKIQGTQVIQRTFTLLRLLADNQDQGLRIVDMAKQCQIHAPTVHRIIAALIAEQMVVRDKHSRRYRLGPMAFELGSSASPSFNLLELCSPSLQRLAQTSGDTSFLFLRRGNDTVCIDRTLGGFSIQTPVVTVGSRQPLGVNAGGLAILLAMAEDEVRLVLDAVSPRLDIYGNCDVLDIKRAINHSLELGYAVIGERAVPGVTAMGLAILSPSGSPVAALTLAATTGRLTRERQAELLPVLREEVKYVENLLYESENELARLS